MNFRRLLALSSLALAGALSAAASLAAPAQQPLELLGRTNLPGYNGDFDHLFADIGQNKLFVAAEDHATVEVFNLKTGAHLRTLKTFETPHAFFLVPGTHRLIVTDNSKEGSRIIDDRNYKVLGYIKLEPGADTEYYDKSTKHLYIVTGGDDVNLKNCWLNEINPWTGKLLRSLKFDSSHVEAVRAEQHGDRLFINVADKNEVDVVSKKTLQVIDHWPLVGAQVNLALAINEPAHRLFVVTRKPTRLLVLNTDNGKTVANIGVPDINDGVYFDSARKRLYIPGAVGQIGVIQELDPDHYQEIARVPSAPGTKSELLVPELNELFVAASPQYSKPPEGAVLRYKVEPTAAKLAQE